MRATELKSAPLRRWQPPGGHEKMLGTLKLHLNWSLMALVPFCTSLFLCFVSTHRRLLPYLTGYLHQSPMPYTHLQNPPCYPTVNEGID